MENEAKTSEREYPAPKWGRLYARFCPMFTDPYSRHARMIAGNHFRDRKSAAYQEVLGYDDPEHLAQSIEVTVINLWKLRKAVADAGLTIEHDKRGRLRLTPTASSGEKETT